MKILAIIVTYYPNMELLRKNVQALLSDVDELLIWENMAENEASKYRIFSEDKIKYVGESKNLGISKALNYAWHYAVLGKFDYILTMDQDSIFINFKEFKNKVFSSTLYKSAIFAPHQGDKTLQIPFREIDHCITSGALVHIDILNTTGGYLEDFMIDGIDIEFCYRARSFGFRTVSVGGCELIQQYGDSHNKKILWKVYSVYNYTPFRLYGILKNFKIVSLLYPHEKSIKKEIKRSYLKAYIRNILLFEVNKKDKLLAIFSGYLHGKYYKNKKKLKFFDKFLPIYNA